MGSITKLNTAVWKDSWEHLDFNYEDSVYYLLLRKANPNCQADGDSLSFGWQRGDTPLLYVLRNIHTNPIKRIRDCLLLLQAGANPNLKNAQGISANDFIKGNDSLKLVQDMFDRSNEIYQAKFKNQFSIYDWFFTYNQHPFFLPNRKLLLGCPVGCKKTFYQIMKDYQVVEHLPENVNEGWLWKSAMSETEKFLNSQEHPKKAPVSSLKKQLSQRQISSMRRTRSCRSKKTIGRSTLKRQKQNRAKVR